jgi:hypothetical protein
MSAVITFQKLPISVRPSSASGLVVRRYHEYLVTSLALGRSVDKYTIISKTFQANCFSLSISNRSETRKREKQKESKAKK